MGVQATADGGKVLRRDAAENRRRLLDAAATVFSERGLDAGVEEIARVAGVGMGTLYRRFPTKDALISELVRQLLVDLVAMARAARDVTDGSGLERLLFDTGAIQASHRGCVSRMWNDEHTTLLRDEFRTILAELLAVAQDAGRIRSDVTVTDLDIVFWAVRGVVETTRGVSDTAWRRHLAVVVAGLRPGGEELSEPPVGEREVALAKKRILAGRTGPS
ncbi:TetR/AcrR family transcriptional regulator [Williamsia muralis]|uniref:Helix-turn-helix domain-containing protein n=1 Tax=Williamsia marianensis TaxID=85044 RepID=A0ABU4EU82_WILMA|nr:helix-turn-helix domain-containing protein [Williamsia muralis]MDV7134779.1 helix-turn-helix domain-containing protein [Williamsia muralis]